MLTVYLSLPWLSSHLELPSVLHLGQLVGLPVGDPGLELRDGRLGPLDVTLGLVDGRLEHLPELVFVRLPGDLDDLALLAIADFAEELGDFTSVQAGQLGHNAFQVGNQGVLDVGLSADRAQLPGQVADGEAAAVQGAVTRALEAVVTDAGAVPLEVAS